MASRDAAVNESPKKTRRRAAAAGSRPLGHGAARVHIWGQAAHHAAGLGVRHVVLEVGWIAKALEASKAPGRTVEDDGRAVTVGRVAEVTGQSPYETRPIEALGQEEPASRPQPARASSPRPGQPAVRRRLMPLPHLGTTAAGRRQQPRPRPARPSSAGVAPARPSSGSAARADPAGRAGTCR